VHLKVSSPTDSVQTADPLLDSTRLPGQVEVHKMLCKLKVPTFFTRTITYEDKAIAIASKPLNVRLC